MVRNIMYWAIPSPMGEARIKSLSAPRHKRRWIVSRAERELLATSKGFVFEWGFR